MYDSSLDVNVQNNFHRNMNYSLNKSLFKNGKKYVWIS